MLHALRGSLRKRGAAARLTLLALLGSIVAAALAAALIGTGATPASASTSLTCQSASGVLTVTANGGGTSASSPLQVSTTGAGNSSSSDYSFAGGVDASACNGGGINPGTTVAPTAGSVILSQAATRTEQGDSLQFGSAVGPLSGTNVTHNGNTETIPTTNAAVQVGMTVTASSCFTNSQTVTGVAPGTPETITFSSNGSCNAGASDNTLTLALVISNVTTGNGLTAVTAPGGFPGAATGSSVTDLTHSSAIAGGTTLAAVPTDTAILSANATATGTSSNVDFSLPALAGTFSTTTYTITATTSTLIQEVAEIQPGMQVTSDTGNGTGACFTNGTVVDSTNFPASTASSTVTLAVTLSAAGNTVNCPAGVDTGITFSSVLNVVTTSGSPDVTAVVDGAGGFANVFPGMTVSGTASIPSLTTVDTYSTAGAGTPNGSPNSFVLSAAASRTCSDSLTFSTNVASASISSHSTIVTSSSGFSGVVPGMSVASSTSGDINGGTYVDWVNGDTLSLNTNAGKTDSTAPLTFSTPNPIPAYTANGSAVVVVGNNGTLPTNGEFAEANGGFAGVVAGMTVTDPSTHCFTNTDTVSAVGTAGASSLPLTAAATASNSSITLTFATSVGNVSTTNHSATVTSGNSDSFPGVVAGMSVSGTDITGGTTVSSINGNTLTLSGNATGNFTGTLQFSTSIASVATTDNSFLATASGGFPSVVEAMSVSGAFAVSVDPTVVITGPASTTEYVVIDNHSGNLASVAAGCVPQFQLQFPSSTTSATLVVEDNDAPAGTGDDNVAASTAVSGGLTSENVTMSEGACTSPDITVAGGNAVPTVDVQGIATSGNLLDLSSSTATSQMTVSGSSAFPADTGVTVSPSSPELSATSFANAAVGDAVSDSGGCIPTGDAVESITTGIPDTISLAVAPTGSCASDSVTFSTPGQVVGLPGAATNTALIEFTGEQTVDGPDAPTTFQPGTAPSIDFQGLNSVANTLDLSQETLGSLASLTVAMNGDSSSSQGTIVGTLADSSGGTRTLTSGSPDQFTNVSAVTGTPSGATSFQPGSATGTITFTGGSGATNTLDLSSEPSASFTGLKVAMNGSAPCTGTGQGELTSASGSSVSLTDCFTNVSKVAGAANEPTTFQPGTVNNVTFTGGSGAGVVNTLDLTNESTSNFSSLSVAMSATCTGGTGDVTGVLSSTTVLTDCFSNVSSVNGATSVATTFQPGTVSGVTFTGGTGSGVVNVIDLTAETTTAFNRGLTVAMTSPCSLTSGSGAGEISSNSGSTTSLTDCFSNATLINPNQSAGVAISFAPGTVNNVTFNGGSTASNTVDLSAETSSLFGHSAAFTVSMTGTSPCTTGESELLSSGGSPSNITDCFTNAQTVLGAPLSTTFQPGTTTGITFGGSGNGILDLSQETAPAALTVSLGANASGAGNEGTLSGTSSGNAALSDFVYGLSSVIGSPNGTTFGPGSATGVTFSGASGATNALTLQAESGVNCIGSGITAGTPSGTSLTLSGGTPTCSATGATLTFTLPISGVTTTAGSPNVTGSFAGSGVAAGMLVSGPGIPSATTVLSVGATSLVLSQAATGSPTSLTFATSVSGVNVTSSSPTVTAAGGFPNVVSGMGVSAGSFTVTMTSASCSGTGQVAATVGGSTVLADCFSNVTSVFGAATVPTSFQPGTASLVTFDGGANAGGTGSAENTIDLTSETSSSFKSLTVAMNSSGPCAVSGPGELSSGSGSSVSLTDCFNNVTLVKGATTVPTTFQPGTTTGSTFTGGTGSGVVNTVDLSGESTSAFSALTVAMTATGATPCLASGQGEITGTSTTSPLTDCFSNATLVNGASSVNTAFQPGIVNGVTFTGGTGSGVSNTVDLSGETATSSGGFFGSGATFTASMTGNAACPTGGELLSTGGSLGNVTDCFSGVSNVLGAPLATTFQPGTTTGVTFGDCGTSPLPSCSSGTFNGVLDLSGENGGAHLTVNVAADSTPSASEGSLSGTSSSGGALADAFYGVASVLGSPNGTDFQPGTASGVTFSGEGGAASNDVDLTKESTPAFNQFTVAMDSATAYAPMVADATVVAGSPGTVTVPSGGFPGVIDGMVATVVSGSEIPASTTVVSEGLSGGLQTLTLSAPVTTGATGVTLSFSYPTVCSTAEGAVLGGKTNGGSSVLDDCFSDVGVVNGTPTGIVSVFEPDPRLTSTPSPTPQFIGNNPTAESGSSPTAGGSVVDLDLSGFASGGAVSGVTAELNGDSPGSVGQINAVVSGNPVTFATFYRAIEILGAPQSTTFRPDVATNVDLVGQSAGNALDLSDDTSSSFGSSGSFTVAMATTSASCAAGEGQVTSAGSLSIANCFADVSTVDGSPLQTTFVPANQTSSSPPTFVGFDSNPKGSVLDLSGGGVASGITSAVTVQLNADTTTTPATVTQTGILPVATYANFAGVDEVIAPSAAATDFQPGSAPSVLLAGSGSSANPDTLDLSAETSPASGLVATVNNDSSGVPGALTGTSQGATTLNDQFFGIASVIGSPQGTTLAVGPNLSKSFTFAGYCGGGASPLPAGPATNILDLSTTTTSLTVTGSQSTPSVTVPTGWSCTGASPPPPAEAEASFTLGSPVTAFGVTEIKGSTTVATNWVPGNASGVQFVAQGSGANTLNLSGASTPYVVNMATGTYSGATSGSFQGVDDVIGSTGGTTFEAATTGGVVFTGEGTASGNALDLPSDGGLLTVAVNGDSGSSLGQLTGLSQGFSNLTSDTFSGVGTIVGNPGTGGTTFLAQPVSGNTIDYTGAGSGADTLSFAPITSTEAGTSVPLAINLTSSPGQASLSGSTFADFAGMTAYIACTSGTACQSTTLTPQAGSSATFTGRGSSNTLDYSGISGGAGVTLTESSGSGSATVGNGGGTIPFSGVQTFNGSPYADVFSLGTGNVTVHGGGGDSTVSLAGDQPGISFTLSYDNTTGSSSCAAPPTASELATILIGTGSAGTDCTTDITNFTGSSSGQNTFVSDGFGGHSFQAGGTSNTMSLANASGSLTPTVTATGTAGAGNTSGLATNAEITTTPGGAGNEDLFSGFQTFNGAPGSTRFVSNGTNSLTFNGGTASNDILDLSLVATTSTNTLQVQDGAPVSGVTGLCNGSVISASSSESFTDIAQVVGPSSGNTTFVAKSGSALVGGCAANSGTPPVTFVGNGVGNKLDVSAVPASEYAILPTTAAPTGCIAPTEATAYPTPSPWNLGSSDGCPSSGELETFQDIQSFAGSSSGGTTFVAGPTSGFSFTGQGTGNALSFANIPSTGGAQVSLNTGAVQLASGSDSFSGITTIIGSRGTDTYLGGSGNFTIEGAQGTASQPGVPTASATFSDASAAAATTLQLVNGTGTVTGSFSGTTTTTGVTTFVGSSVGGNTFLPDGNGGYTFQVPGSSSGNLLSFADATAGVGTLRLAITSTTGGGTASGLAGSTSDSFQGFQAFVGAPNSSNAFTAGNGQFSLAGNGTGTNSLDLSQATVPVTFTLTTTTSMPVTVSGTAVSGGTSPAVSDSISGFSTYTGSGQGGNTFHAASGGGFVLNGGGPGGNTLDLTSAPSQMVLTANGSGLPGQVTSLSSGIGSSTADTFGNMQTFLGSSSSTTSQPATFDVDCGGGQNLDGQGSGTQLALSYSGCSSPPSSTPAPTINATTTPGTISGLPGGPSDTFTNIVSFVGPTAGDTTFVAPGATSGYAFAGGLGSTGNTFDASAFPTGAVLNDSATLTDGTSPDNAALGQSQSDTFSNVQCFVGSTAGGTTFVVPSLAPSQAGCFEHLNQPNFLGSQTGNALVLNSVPATPASPLTVTPPLGTVSNPSGTFATFAGMQSFLGSLAGDTNFVTGSAGSLGFTGQGSASSNSISFADVPPSGGVTVSLTPNGSGQQTAQPGGGMDTFTGISTIAGSPGTDSFVGGAGTFTIDDCRCSIPAVGTTSGSKTITYSSGAFPFFYPGIAVSGTGIPSGATVVSATTTSAVLSAAATASGTPALSFGSGTGSASFNDSPAANGMQLQLSSGTGTITGSFAGVTTTYGVTTFTGAPNGGNSVVSDGEGGYTFNGASTGNSLSFSNASTTGVTIDIADSSGDGSVSGLPGGTDTFRSFQSFTGSGAGDTSFEAGNGDYTLKGLASNDSLSLATASSGVIFNLSQVTALSPTFTATNNLVNDTASGFVTIDGASIGGNTFDVPFGGGYTFAGTESATGGNTLNLNAAPTTVSVAQSSSQQFDGTVNGFTGGPTSDAYSGIQTIVDSSQVTYDPSCIGGLQFGGTSSTTLTLPSGCGDLTVNAAAGVVSNSSGTLDTFTGITQFVGPTTGDTTFVAPGGTTGGYSFAAKGLGNTFDASAFPSGAVLNTSTELTDGVAALTATVGPTAEFDTFSGVQCFVGSSQGDTTFVAPSSALSQAGCVEHTGQPNFLGGKTANTLDLTNIGASGSSPLTVTPPASPLGTVSNSAGTLDTFSGVQSFLGSTGGYTAFVNGPSGGLGFTGQGTASTNSVSFAAVPASGGVSVSLEPNSSGQETAQLGNGTQDTFTGIDQVIGSPGSDTFFGGPGNFAIEECDCSVAATTTSGSATISGSFPSGVLAGMAVSGTGIPTGSYVVRVSGSTATISAPATASGTGVVLTFGTGNATFNDSPATSPMSLSLASGTATITGSFVNSRTTTVGVTTFLGAPVGGNSFLSDGEGGYNFDGPSGTSGNTLSYASAGTGVTIDVTSSLGSGTVSGLSGGGDTFQGFLAFTGSAVGGTTFVAADGSGQTFKGQGSAISNTLSIPSAPVSTVVDTTTHTVTLGGGAGSIQFSGINSFVGATAGVTTFRPDPTNGYSFTGLSAGNTLDLSNGPQDMAVDLACTQSVKGTPMNYVVMSSTPVGCAAPPANSVVDDFTGMSKFVGSSEGATAFTSPPPTTATVLGAGVTSQSTIVTAAGGFPGVVIGDSVAGPAAAGIPPGDTVQSLSGTSLTLSNAATGTTGTYALTFAGGGGLSFTGLSGTGNSLSYSSLPPGPGVTLNLRTGTVNDPQWGIGDTFTGFQSFTGSPNADTFYAGPVTATLTGGGGSDTISFAQSDNVPANVTLGSSATVSGVATGGFVSAPADLTLFGIQNVVGSRGGGTIIGNSLPSVFTGGQGANDFVVDGGTDVIDGGGGANTLDLSGAKKFVTLNLGVSGPQVTGGDGILTLVPGTITNVIGGNDGNRLIAGPGNVTLNGGEGTDWLQAGSGTDFLNAGSAAATLVGGTGFDTMTGGGGSDTFIPGTGGGKMTDTQGIGTLDDQLATQGSFPSGCWGSTTSQCGVTVNLSSSTYTTPDHKVTLEPDQATGGGGLPITVIGLTGIEGTNYGDVLVGSSSANRIVAGNGTNLIVGNGGGDNITTGTGTNVIITGPGNNTVKAGTGTNTVDYASAPGAVNVNLAKDTAKNGWGGTDTLIGITNIIGSSNSGDVLELGPHGGEAIAGGGNNDSLLGSSGGGSTLIGGGGSDTIVSYGPNDHMIGGAGDDSFFGNNGFVDYFTGGSGYNIAYVDCLDVKDKTFTEGTAPGDIEEVHLPSSGCPSSIGGPPSPPPVPVLKAVPFVPNGGLPLRPTTRRPVSPVRAAPVVKKTKATTAKRKPVTTTKKPTTTTTKPVTTTTKPTVATTTTTVAKPTAPTSQQPSSTGSTVRSGSAGASPSTLGHG